MRHHRHVPRCHPSEARVNRFLAGVEKDRPRPSPYKRENAAHYDELVAACAAVASPEEAVCSPVWRAAVGDAPVTLSTLLSPEVRQYRRVVARVEAAQEVHEEHRRRYLVNDLQREWPALAEAIDDDEAAAVIRYLFDGPLHAINAREEWGLAHLDIVEATVEWWTTARSDAGAVPPTPLAASLHALPLHRRVRADRADLEAAYDAAHLLVCPSCALPRNDEDAAGRYHAPTCRCCGGTLVPLVEAPALPPPLEFRRPGGPGRVVSRLPRPGRR